MQELPLNNTHREIHTLFRHSQPNFIPYIHFFNPVCHFSQAESLVDFP